MAEKYTIKHRHNPKNQDKFELLLSKSSDRFLTLLWYILYLAPVVMYFLSVVKFPDIDDLKRYDFIDEYQTNIIILNSGLGRRS